MGDAKDVETIGLQAWRKYKKANYRLISSLPQCVIEPNI